MALTVQSPSAGVLQIDVKIGASRGGIIVATPLPSGVTLPAPADGALPILGAAVVAHISGGTVVVGLP